MKSSRDGTDSKYDLGKLLEAIRCKDNETIKCYIEDGESPNAVYKRKACLMAAIEHAAVDIVKLLVIAGADIDYQDDSGYTPLMVAVKSENPDIISYLLSQNVDSKMVDRKGCSALWYAVSQNFQEGTSLILSSLSSLIQNDRAAKEDIVSLKTTTIPPLNLACEKGYIDIVKLFLLTDCDMNSQLAFSYPTPLHCAVQNDHLMVVKTLIESKAIQRDLQDHHGETPVFLATKLNRWQHIKALTLAGWNPNTPNNQGIPPIQFALESNLQNCLETLLKCGCDANTKIKPRSNNIHSPLHIVCSSLKPNPDTVLLLLQHGADPNFSTKCRFLTCGLHLLAAKSGCKESAKHLIQYGANLDQLDGYSRTCLMIAIEEGQKELLNMLIETGIRLPGHLVSDGQHLRFVKEVFQEEMYLKMMEYHSSPETLLKMCALVIRCHLQHPFVENLNILPLPVKMIFFVRMFDL